MSKYQINHMFKIDAQNYRDTFYIILNCTSNDQFEINRTIY